MSATVIAPDVLAHPAFSDLDRRFAEFLQRVAKTASAELALAAALVSRSRGEGHICLDLRQVAGSRFPAEQDFEAPVVDLPPLASWIAGLRECPVVGEPGDFAPLVLDKRGRLYLHRYWQYEANLAAAIRSRAGVAREVVDATWLHEALRRYFPTDAIGEMDWQKVAAFTALTRNFCVISGGPGTGKTRTVAVLLAMLLEQAVALPLRVALAAPTGKAAARLQESIKNAKTALPCDDAVKQRLPVEASTLHRLLGTVRDSAFFKHNATNPLPYDVVVIDEASMVDLALMAKLFDALPPMARVILLGDKDQLASVEAGAVLGDICLGGPINAFSSGVRTQYHCLTGEALPAVSANETALGDCIVELQKNRRFVGDNSILTLSRAVNDGDTEQALELMRDASGIAFSSLPSETKLKGMLRDRVLAGFHAALKAPDANSALQALNSFRILCALRQGPFGIGNVNRLVEEILDEAGLIGRHERWYAGRPVMVLKNDYNLRLFNGDTGIVRPDDSGRARVFFLDAGNELRSLAPVRLPEHETVFAMTVHKSQGSEFEEVLLVLPDRENPVLTRELIYTGITRASRRVELWSNETVFRAALERRVERTSGLSDALWQ